MLLNRFSISFSGPRGGSSAVTENITCETFEQFRDRVLKSLERLPRDVIDRTVETLNDRIDAIIYSKGSRTKY